MRELVRKMVVSYSSLLTVNMDMAHARTCEEYGGNLQ
jgi:hypothetical protein